MPPSSSPIGYGLVAADMLECAAGDVELVDGSARVVGTPDRSVSLRRVAGAAHWDPAGLPDGVDGLSLTTTFSVPGLAAPAADDTVNSSAAYGFLADVAVVEVDTETGEVTVRDYITVHDAGRVLHPELAEGQVLGGLAHGLGAALLERHVYDDAGNLLTSTFVDYPTPTATELPRATTEMVESPSPVTPLGAKGLGEGTTMTAPAAIANAIADALGVDCARRRHRRRTPPDPCPGLGPGPSPPCVPQSHPLLLRNAGWTRSAR